MELKDYVRIIRQRGWVLILLAVITAGSAYGYSRMQPVEYESTVRILVSPSRTDFGLTQTVKLLLRNYTQWMSSSKRAQKVIDELGLDRTPDQLLGNVGISADESSFVIQLEVRDSELKNANDIARTWGNLLIQWVDSNNAQLRKEDRINIELVDDPRQSGFTPNVRINTLAGGVFGALVGVIIIFLLEWIDSGILRRKEDIEKHLDLPVIGSIPRN
ncbi:MAG: succinoglycan biosynthesis transport protein ExoP [Cellvibrionaceae bacterium]|jgi:succinoglycan biosynthesis transport protein ExoP